ncbi:MAG: metalloregulator ArsR/SmtB family transcription factor [Candidatus Gracilibacteria bacterium]|nr:metalloregulator ArsR/SmtB family transcription factor [Candidatus Gracilibacteria bacterium]
MSNFCLSDEKNIDFLKESFNLLSEPNRIKILCLLGKNEKLCVCEIIKALGLKQNLISHHLSMFKRIGLFEQKKVGTNIYYSINKEVYDKLKTLVGNIFNF